MVVQFRPEWVVHFHRNLHMSLQPIFYIFRRKNSRKKVLLQPFPDGVKDLRKEKNNANRMQMKKGLPDKYIWKPFSLLVGIVRFELTTRCSQAGWFADYFTGIYTPVLGFFISLKKVLIILFFMMHFQLAYRSMLPHCCPTYINHW